MDTARMIILFFIVILFGPMLYLLIRVLVLNIRFEKANIEKNYALAEFMKTNFCKTKKVVVGYEVVLLIIFFVLSLTLPVFK